MKYLHVLHSFLVLTVISDLSKIRVPFLYDFITSCFYDFHDILENFWRNSGIIMTKQTFSFLSNPYFCGSFRKDFPLLHVREPVQEDHFRLTRNKQENCQF